jgi:hypothetical protein
VNTPAFGTVVVRFYQFPNGVISYEGYARVRKLSVAPTGFHIHRANAGSNGPIVVDLFDQTNIRKDFGDGNMSIYFRGRITDRVISGSTVTREQILNSILTGGAYFNLHNSLFPAGEIRGQIR